MEEERDRSEAHVSRLPAVGRPGGEPGASGLVYWWDLDKTYLRTEFDTLRDLVRLAFEPAARKRTVPGAAALMRELGRSESTRIRILSASPELLRRVLEAKLRLDGVRWDALMLKPSLRELARGRWREVREPMGYKLLCLLEAEANETTASEEVLFGDDAEADAFIYSMYADIGEGRLDAPALLRVCEKARLYGDVASRLAELCEGERARRHTRRIFIHLDRVSAPQAFSDYGPRLCPFHNYFQPALVLLEEGLLDAAATLRVGMDIVAHHRFGSDALVASFFDLVRREYIGPKTGLALLRHIEAVDRETFGGASEAVATLSAELRLRMASLPPPRPPMPSSLNYGELFARDRARAKAARHWAQGVGT